MSSAQSSADVFIRVALDQFNIVKESKKFPLLKEAARSAQSKPFRPAINSSSCDRSDCWTPESFAHDPQDNFSTIHVGLPVPQSDSCQHIHRLPRKAILIQLLGQAGRRRRRSRPRRCAPHLQTHGAGRWGAKEHSDEPSHRHNLRWLLRKRKHGREGSTANRESAFILCNK